MRDSEPIQFIILVTAVIAATGAMIAAVISLNMPGPPTVYRADCVVNGETLVAERVIHPSTGGFWSADARVKYSLTGNVKCRFEQVE